MGRPNSVRGYEEAVLRSLNLTQNSLASSRYQHTRNSGHSSTSNSPFTNQRTFHNQAPFQEHIGISTNQWSGNVGVLSPVNSSGMSMNSVAQPRNALSHHSLQSFSGRQGSQCTLPTYTNNVRCSAFVQQHAGPLKNPFFDYELDAMDKASQNGSPNFVQNQHDPDFYPQPSASAAARMFRSFKRPFTASASGTSVTQSGGGLSDHGVSSFPGRGMYQASTSAFQHGAANAHTNHASRFQFASRLPPSGFDTVPPQNLTPDEPEKDKEVQGPNYQIL